VLTRLQGGLSAVAATLLAVGLVIIDLTNRGFRGWWQEHPLTTDVTAGVLVLLITLLVVDQLVRSRQFNDRSRAVAAQAAILMAQARRSTEAVSSVLGGSGDRGAASDEVRTYMMMLLVAAPVLIDPAVSRAFLEQAQRLGGEMVRALTAVTKTVNPTTVSRVRLDDALERLGAASTPLLQVLDFEQFIAADGGESQ